MNRDDLRGEKAPLRARVAARQRAVRDRVGNAAVMVMAFVVFCVAYLIWLPAYWLWVRVRNRAEAAFGSGRAAFGALTAASAAACLVVAGAVTDPWSRGLLMEVGGALLLFLGLQVVLGGRQQPHRALTWSLVALAVAALAVTFVDMHPPAATTRFRTELLLKIGGGLLLFVVLEVWLTRRMAEARKLERGLLIRIAQEHPETPLWKIDPEGGGFKIWLDDAEAMHLNDMQGALEVPFPSLPYYDDIDLARQEAWEAEQRARDVETQLDRSSTLGHGPDKVEHDGDTEVGIEGTDEGPGRA